MSSGNVKVCMEFIYFSINEVRLDLRFVGSLGEETVDSLFESSLLKILELLKIFFILLYYSKIF